MCEQSDETGAFPLKIFQNSGQVGRGCRLYIHSVPTLWPVVQSMFPTSPAEEIKRKFSAEQERADQDKQHCREHDSYAPIYQSYGDVGVGSISATGPIRVVAMPTWVVCRLSRAANAAGAKGRTTILGPRQVFTRASK